MWYISSTIQFSSVTQSCLLLCDPMNCRTPGLPVHHQHLEFTQTPVHWVADAIQRSHPLFSLSPPATNPSQHQEEMGQEHWGQEEKGTKEDEMAGWHHRLDRHEFGWTPGVGDGQGGLACCDSWGHRESDTTERLNDWTEQLLYVVCLFLPPLLPRWPFLSLGLELLGETG